MNSITFLGTGGGRYIILSQRRYSGGIWLDFGAKIVLDPGPGALIRALQFHREINKLDAVLVSHNHLDHYNDAEVMIEAMTGGMKKKRGALVTTPQTLPYISEYHKSAVEVIIPEPNEKFRIGDIEVEALPTYKHENALGFKFFTKEGVVCYGSDTDYSEEQVRNYMDSKILILNVIFPKGREIETHLNTDKALKIVKQAKPELAIINHFGIQMLNANPENEAKYIEDESGIQTIAAKDGMTLNLEEMNKIGTQATLSGF